MSNDPLRYEDAAVKVTLTGENGEPMGTGWMSVRSRHVWRECDEHHARYQDATDFPCDCGDRREKPYTLCEACRAKAEDERWAKSLAEDGVDWDGKTPLSVEGGDRFLFGEQDVCDYLDGYVGDGDALEDVWLVLCTAENGPGFAMQEFLADALPDEDHGGHSLDTKDIDKTVNDWIAAHAPFSWWPSSTPVKPESLRAYMPEPAPDEPDDAATPS